MQCSGPLKDKTPPWYRLQLLKGGSYASTGVFWAQPNLSYRSIKGHPMDAGAIAKVIQTKTCEPPAASVLAPAMIRVDMEVQDMWSEFDDHMAQGTVEVEEVDPAFELDFYGFDPFSLEASVVAVLERPSRPMRPSRVRK